MLDLLPFDLIILIYELNKLKLISKMNIVNKYMYKCYSNLTNINWYNICLNEYSNEFWIKAKQRTKYISKPLNNFKKELIRLKIFEKKYLELTGDTLIEKD